mmetsp:Transcript_26388/g.75644  ORF Transcript_26388/g.75644 Transcript_26388/m.75644 type:complete len:224 (+) Transcript_26388:632-1303(+)
MIQLGRLVDVGQELPEQLATLLLIWRHQTDVESLLSVLVEEVYVPPQHHVQRTDRLRRLTPVFEGGVDLLLKHAPRRVDEAHRNVWLRPGEALRHRPLAGMHGVTHEPIVEVSVRELCDGWVHSVLLVQHVGPVAAQQQPLEQGQAQALVGSRQRVNGGRELLLVADEYELPAATDDGTQYRGLSGLCGFIDDDSVEGMFGELLVGLALHTRGHDHLGVTKRS